MKQYSGPSIKSRNVILQGNSTPSVGQISNSSFENNHIIAKYENMMSKMKLEGEVTAQKNKSLLNQVADMQLLIKDKDHLL